MIVIRQEQKQDHGYNTVAVIQAGSDGGLDLCSSSEKSVKCMASEDILVVKPRGLADGWDIVDGSKEKGEI